MKRTFFILLGCIVLIIGFFLYTSKKAKPEKMMLSIENSKPDSLNLLMPKNGDRHSSKYEKVETKLTLLLLGQDLIYGYIGNNIATGKTYNYADIRSLIKQESAKYSPEKFIILIKPGETATYKNSVDILDEMTINNIRKYEMSGISDSEGKFVTQFEQIVKK